MITRGFRQKLAELLGSERVDDFLRDNYMQNETDPPISGDKQNKSNNYSFTTKDSDLDSDEESRELTARLLKLKNHVEIESQPENPIIENRKDPEVEIEKDPVKMTEQKLHPEEIKSLIPLFDDTKMSVNVWIDKIEKLQKSLKWSPELTLLYATSRLGGIPEMWFQNVVVEDFNDFVAQIKEEFKRVVNLAEVHNNLRKMMKEKNETYDFFAYRVKMYGKQYGVQDSDIITYVVNGLQREDVYNSLAILRFANFQELIQVLKNYESNVNLKKQTAIQMSQKPKEKPEKESTSQNSEKSNKIKCYNCNEVGHLSKSCQKPRKKCENCKKLGHTTEECKKGQGVHIMKKQSGSQTGNQKEQNLMMKLDDEGRTEVQVVLGSHVSKMNALVDTGSSISCISDTLVENAKCKIDKNEKILVHGINDSKLEVLGKVSCLLIINDRSYKADLWVVPKKTSSHELIVGRDFLISNKLMNLVFDKKKEIIVNDKKFDSMMMKEVISMEEGLYSLSDEIELEIGDTDETKKYRSEITQAFFENYVDREKPPEPLIKSEVELRFKELKPFSARPSRLSNVEREALKEIVQDLLERGIIRESDSCYTSNVVMSRKKNGKFRMCVNFKTLNRMVECDHFPMPVAEGLIEELEDQKYFSSMDLKDGFFHVAIKEGFEKYFAFVTEEGVYEFVVLPFGFKNGPPEFFKHLKKILIGLIRRKKVKVFYDDILVCTESIIEHIEVLIELFQTLADNHIQLQLSKCRFLITRVEFLGYEISKNKITLTQDHLDAVKNYPVPYDFKSLQRFMGFASYFRKFVKDFNKIASSLYDCMKTGKDFKFDGKCLESFEELKQKLLERPVLSIYSTSAETQLHTDASSFGFGGILLQKQKYDDDFHPIMYFSRKTTEAESKLHSFELETLAVVYSVKRFRTYLYGLHFKLVTDCKAMQLTLNKKDINPKITRWALYLEQFDFEIIHRPGEKMQHVDALSRNCMLTMEDEDVQTVFDSALCVNQIRDVGISRLKERILKNEVSDYVVRDGLVYRSEKGKLLLYVPDSMVDSVLNRYHNSLGHFGVDKVCEMIRRLFYFPNMRKIVGDHIRKCITCITYNPPLNKLDGKMHIPEKGKVPFETVHADHLGPLAKTKGKNLHILAIVDDSTKFCKLYSAKTTNTQEVLKSLKRYKYDYSTPRRIITDRGSAFTSKQFKSFVDDYKIEHVMVATACPQANGQVERYNRTLVPLLAKLVEESGTEWDNVLADAEFLLNNTWNRSINNVPSVVLFGIVQRRNISQGLIEYCENLNEKADRDLEAIREEACKTARALQEYNKTQYDKRCKRSTTYNVDDLVCIRGTKTVGENSKLMKKFKGPYVVRKVLDKDRYLISDIDGYQVSNRRFEGIFDPKNMRLYQRPNGHTDDPTSPHYCDVDVSDISDSE